MRAGFYETKLEEYNQGPLDRTFNYVYRRDFIKAFSLITSGS